MLLLYFLQLYRGMVSCDVSMKLLLTQIGHYRLNILWSNDRFGFKVLNQLFFEDKKIPKKYFSCHICHAKVVFNLLVDSVVT